MTASSQQIVTCYEELGMSPEEIVAAGHGQLLAVKAVLVQWSAKYRTAMQADQELDFNDNDKAQAVQVIRSLAFNAEDEHLRARMSRYIRDDTKGRLDVAKGLQNLNISFALFAEHLEKANEIVSQRRRNGSIKPNPAQQTIEAEVVSQ